jgi:hypothetical protein
MNANVELTPPDWPPFPTAADDDVCPLCGECRTRRVARELAREGELLFWWRQGLTWADGVDYLRRASGDGGGYRSRGPVLWALRVLSLTAWRERHGWCR